VEIQETEVENGLQETSESQHSFMYSITSMTSHITTTDSIQEAVHTVLSLTRPAALKLITPSHLLNSGAKKSALLTIVLQGVQQHAFRHGETFNDTFLTNFPPSLAASPTVFVHKAERYKPNSITLSRLQTGPMLVTQTCSELEFGLSLAAS